eukprot:2498655-Prymnesium_polylepis.1
MHHHGNTSPSIASGRSAPIQRARTSSRGHPPARRARSGGRRFRHTCKTASYTLSPSAAATKS